jgi:hypothetical protein
MARCPNCGRDTKRTIDWACQWCGYPLVSNAFKKIEKTWREIKEERIGGSQPDFRATEPAPAYRHSPPPPPPDPPPSYRQAPPPPPPPAYEPPPPPGPEEPQPVMEKPVVPEPGYIPAEEQKVAQPPSEPVSEPQPEEVPETPSNAKDEPEVMITPPPSQEPVITQPPPPPPPPPSQPEAGAPDFRMTIDELRHAFKTAEVETEDSLRNKIIRIIGIVDKIEVNEQRALYNLILTGAQKGEEYRDVECRFQRRYADDLNSLSVGQTVTVDGYYSGYVIDIILRQCVIVR